MRRLVPLTLVLAVACFIVVYNLSGCGGSSTTPGGVSVNSLDGATDVTVDSSFTYTFNRSINASTVTSTTYFMVQTPVTQVASASAKAEVDNTICDPAAALGADLETDFGSSTLTPSADLEGNTSYSICLTDGITYLDGTPFSGFMAMLTTGAGGGSTYTVGGTVSGLDTGESVVLQNNAADDLTVSADGAFTFATAIADGAAYAVTVLTAPDGKTCTVGSGTGTIAGANVTDVSVVCSADAYTVGGTVAGLGAGKSVVLQNNGGDDLTVSADGAFTFATAVADGGEYAVTVATQPAGQTCAVASGTGTVAGADVTDVSVACEPDIIAGYRSRWTLSGTLVDSGTAGNDLSGWEREGEDDVPADFTTYSTTVKKAGPSSAQFSDAVYLEAADDPHGGGAPVAYSIALWVYPATGIGDDVGAFNNATGFRINHNSGDLIVGYFGSNFTEAIALDTWTHVVFTYKQDGTEANLYLNGANVGAPLVANFNNALTSTQWMGQGWVGYVDDIVLYDVELSEAQVTELYEAY